MKEIKKLIAEKNPIVKINGTKQNLDKYIYDNYDYSLHSSSYSEKNNTLSLSFISNYEMKKITGECGC
tara:strand:- start:3635 stop:3838 length:204 start_codon:yes stop_codon:yes gene_type:complete